MNADELKRLKELAEKATPGPWRADDFCEEDGQRTRLGTDDDTDTYYHRSATIALFHTNHEEHDLEPQEPLIGIIQAERNAAFAAASRIAVPALIAEVERQAAEIANLTQERNETLAAVRATLSRLMTERDDAKAALARLTTPGAGARKVAKKIASDPHLTLLGNDREDSRLVRGELQNVIQEALTAYAAPHIAARERAERRAEKMQKNLRNIAKVSGRKLNDFPLPMSAMNDTEGEIARIACTAAGNLISINEWARAALAADGDAE